MTTFRLEDFTPRLGDDFVLEEAELEGLSLILTSAAPMPSQFPRPDGHQPFSLQFVGRDGGVLPQKIYRLRHERLGAIDIFLVPSAQDARGTRYEATFN